MRIDVLASCQFFSGISIDQSTILKKILTSHMFEHSVKPWYFRSAIYPNEVVVAFDEDNEGVILVNLELKKMYPLKYDELLLVYKDNLPTETCICGREERRMAKMERA